MAYKSHQSNALRVRSAPPFPSLRNMVNPLDSAERERIKKEARAGWHAEIQRNHSSVTTYSGLHAYKDLDEPTSIRVRPSSPERMNKPHPPDVFLVTRLKKVDGCFDRSAAKREAINRAKSSHELQIRGAQRLRAYHPQRRPSTSRSVRDHKDRENLRQIMDPRAAQATEAWMKVSTKRDAKRIKDAIDEISEPNEIKTDRPITSRKLASDRHQNGVFASNRWLKRAGHEENDVVSRLIEALKNAKRQPIPNAGPHFHITDYSSMFAKAGQKYHHDFQIHPEWHQPWHKQYEKV